jgi:flavodoxin
LTKCRTITILLLLVLTMSLLAACTDKSAAELPDTTPSQNELPVPTESRSINTGQTDPGTGKVLVVYFTKVGNIASNADADAVSSASLRVGDTSTTGTTEVIAEMVHEQVGGDLFQIETVEPYPEDYEATVKQATEERTAGYKPPLKTKVENMEDYDVIYLGHPIWGMSLPAPIASFLSEYDFSGKTIIPFCTHAGYGPGQTVSAIKELVPGAAVLDGFNIERTEISNAEEAVSAWLREIGMDV